MRVFEAKGSPAVCAAMRKITWIILAAIAIGAGSAAGLLTAQIAKAHRSISSQVTVGSDRHDFSLTDTSGQKVSLATYAGKWLLLYFGFTNCPEACPLALSNIGAALKEMGPVANTLQPIFVTIDPERDTPALLKEYLANFGGNIVGLSGSAAETDAVAKAYGVYFAKRPTEHGDYTMDHSTGLYLIAPDGKLLRLFDAALEPEKLAQSLSVAMVGEKQAAAP